MYTEVVWKFLEKSLFFGISTLERERVYVALGHLALPGLNEKVVSLMGDWCAGAVVEIEFDSCYWVALK